jgi:ribosomal protein S7
MTNRQLREKVLKHLTQNGKKAKGEKILLECLKNLHSQSKKQPMELISFAVVNAMPMFKLQKFKRKKTKKIIREIPEFIKKHSSRVSLSVKFILRASSRNEELRGFCSKLQNEILLTAAKKSSAVEMKDDLQKSVYSKKLYYRAFFKY